MKLTKLEKKALLDMRPGASYWWMQKTCAKLSEKGLVEKMKSLNGFILTTDGIEERKKLIHGEEK